MSEEKGILRQLPAGVVDSGFASVATFVVGISAVNLFDDVGRGVYAIFFSAFIMGALLSNELIFTPAEVGAVSHPESERISLVPGSLRLGVGPSLLGALAVLMAIVVTADYAEPEQAAGLAATTAVATVLSPMQDHVRRMLHIAALSWTAALVSIVQLLAVVILVSWGVVADLPVAWIPFGALAGANAVSLAVGLLLVRRNTKSQAKVRLRFRALASKGVWFVLNAAAPAVMGFAVAAIIAWLASPEDLGYAEAARVVAQPVLVLATGLKVVLYPRSVRAAMDRDLPAARRTNTTYLVAVGLGGAAYLLVVGWDWVLNPMAAIVPAAYVLTGLVALTIAANLANAAWFLQSSELAGAGRESSLAGISWITSLVWLMAAFSAGVTGAYARSLGAIAGAGVRYVAQIRVLKVAYRTTDQAESPTPRAQDEAHGLSAIHPDGNTNDDPS